MNLLIYYNPNQNNFYIVYTNFIPFDRKVGYENQYGHILVQILANRGNKLVNIYNYNDLIKLRSKEKESLKSRLANKAISWLNKYRE